MPTGMCRIKENGDQNYSRVQRIKKAASTSLWATTGLERTHSRWSQIDFLLGDIGNFTHNIQLSFKADIR